jgi:group I intron endonuclease
MVPKSFGLNKCGIYCILNTVNNKQYIGSSKNIYHRLKRHQSELRRGVHFNPILLNSYKKHGEAAFIVQIVEEVSPEFLTSREQYYINTRNPEYNITKEVIRNTPSKESRLKISKTLKKQKEQGLLKYPTHDDKKIAITIYDLDCNCIGHYDSQHDAAKKLKLLYPNNKNFQSVVSATVNLKNRRKVKRYKNHFILNSFEECVKKVHTRSDAIKVLVTDLNNVSEVYASLDLAGKALNCSPSAVARALKLNKLLLKKYKISHYESGKQS